MHSTTGLLKKAGSAAALGLLAVVTGTTAPAFAQGKAFPDHPITIVVPFPPGSTADLLPRLLAPAMSKSLGVPVIVENHLGGASGSVGAAAVARAQPDGYTVLMAPSVVLSVNPWLYKDLPYDPEKDFAPITNAASTKNVWVANPDFPAKSLADVIALAKTKPGAIGFASGGNGTSMHLCGEALNTMAGVQLVHIPYKGPGPALKDVIAGHVPLMCDNLSNVLPHVRTGRLRALAITANARMAQLGDVPTVAEAGFPGLDFGVWYSFVAPSKTPKPVIDRLYREFSSALHSQAIAERLDGLGLVIVANSPEEFRSFIAAESERAHRDVLSYHVKVD